MLACVSPDIRICRRRSHFGLCISGAMGPPRAAERPTVARVRPFPPGTKNRGCGAARGHERGQAAAALAEGRLWDGPHRLQQAVCEGNRRLAHVKVALESIIAKGGLDLRTRDAIRAIVESVGGKDGDPPLGELVTGGPVRAVLELQAAVDQRDAKLRCLETQLREARSDLQRDEEIFATRARELRDCKDALRRKDKVRST